MIISMILFVQASWSCEFDSSGSHGTTDRCWSNLKLEPTGDASFINAPTGGTFGLVEITIASLHEWETRRRLEDTTCRRLEVTFGMVESCGEPSILQIYATHFREQVTNCRVLFWYTTLAHHLWHFGRCSHQSNGVVFEDDGNEKGRTAVETKESHA